MPAVAAIEARLGAERTRVQGDGAGVRANVADLVVWTSSDDVVREVCQALSELQHARPSRSIVLRGDRDAVGVTSEEIVWCSPPPDGHGVRVCSEVVTLRGPADGGALVQMATSLVLPDVPVFMLWLDPPAFRSPAFVRLADMAHRHLFDSVRRPETLDALRALLGRDDLRPTDLAWTKVTGWREVVAQLFDPPGHARMLRRLARVEVDYVEGGDAQARLLTGWLQAHVRRPLEVVLTPVVREDMRTGSLTRIALDCGGARRMTIDRPTEGVAVTTSPELPEGRLQLRVPPFAQLIGDELNELARDPTFEAAVRAATGRR